MRSDRFEWDDRKADENLRKHGVAFERATVIFDDPLLVSIEDPDHSQEEERYVTIGSTFFGEVLVVGHTFREERIPIINARRATPAERRRFMNKGFDQISDKDKDDDLRPEYDFSGGVRGKFYQGRGRIVTRISLDEDVAAHYRTTEEVNAALRQLIAEGRAPKPRNE